MARLPDDGEKLIPAHGGFENLKSYQVAELIYDITVRFCDRYITLKSRTHDQNGASGAKRKTEYR